MIKEARSIVARFPYTLSASILIGLLLAPAVLSMWDELRDRWDARHPVVRMRAEVVEQGPDSILLKLTGEKLRDCDFLGLYAYGVDVGGTMHDVHRERIDSTGPLGRTRPVGPQEFGQWRVWPVRWVSVAMYTRHDCDGRIVLTKVVEVPTSAAAMR